MTKWLLLISAKKFFRIKYLSISIAAIFLSYNCKNPIDTSFKDDKPNDERIRLEIPKNDSLLVVKYVDSLLNATNGVSISLSVGLQDDIVFSLARGYENIVDSTIATTKSQYRIGSVSKVLGSTVLFKFIEKGIVSVNDTLQKWVPEFPIKKFPITLKHILTHTSGIRHYDGSYEKDRMRHTRDFKSLNEAISIFKDEDFLFEPGTQFHYSSYGFNMIQGVLEKVTSKKIELVMEEELFKPLSMNNSLVEVYKERPRNLIWSYFFNQDINKIELERPNNPSYKKIAGGMVSTPNDLVGFMMSLNKREIINDSTFKLMMQTPYDFAEWQCYGWRYNERKNGSIVYHHGGTSRGFITLITFDPENEIYVAVCANYDDFNDTRSDLAYFLMDWISKQKT